jgi:ribosomal protein L11 methyltransferase
MADAADTPDPASGPTVVARLEAGAADAARGLLDQLAEVFDASEAVVSAYDGSGGWTVAIHFNDPPNETAVRALVGLAAGAAAANALTFETLAAKDWVKASQEGLKPVEAGRFIVHSEHYRASVRPNRIGIEIGTAFAFGTGHHGTTRGCLLALDHLLKTQRPLRVLDVGTGTGVLAIAAARVLRRPVLASDIDGRAARVARENIRRNHAPSVTVIHAAGLGMRQFREHGPFDLVLANILLGPLQRMATPMTRLLAPGARVVLSGLLTSQVSAALAAYRRHGLALEYRVVLEGWSTLVLRRGRT